MANSKLIPAADALKSFAKRNLMIVDFRRNGKGEIIVGRVKVEGGREVEGREAVERALTAADVLKATDYGDRIEIITADGRRYSTLDKPAAGDAEGDK